MKRSAQLGSAAVLLLAAQALAQNVPPPGKWTVIVHGRTGSCSYPANYDGLVAAGGWMRQLGSRIEGLNPGLVNTYRMDAATLALVPLNAGATNPLDPTRHHVLLFDWGTTSDFDPILCQAPSGNQNGFAFAAGDSVVSLLKHWEASANVFALIGYSRGAVVVSEASRRLLADRTNPGQVLFLDGEGCEAGGGNGCTFYSDGRFDAWAALKGSVRFDNLYETVNERYLAPTFCATDLGGHARSRCANLNMGGSFAHTAWSLTSACLPSHGQPPVLNYVVSGLTAQGGRYVFPAAFGPVQDPNPPSPTSESIEVPFNGSMGVASLAGWLGNGGSGSATVSSLGGPTTLRIERGQSQTHNHFRVPACATSLRFAAATDGAAAGDSVLSIAISTPGVPDHLFAPIGVGNLPTSVGTTQQHPIPLAFEGRVCRVRFAVTGTTGQAAAHVTGVEVPPCSAVCYVNCDGSTVSPVLSANDFQCFLNRYASGESYANCDGSTATPSLTPNDFQCFLNGFAAGCP